MKKLKKDVEKQKLRILNRYIAETRASNYVCCNESRATNHKQCICSPSTTLSVIEFEIEKKTIFFLFEFRFIFFASVENLHRSKTMD